MMKIGESDMSSINEKDIENFIEWATENEDKFVFKHASENENTYYTVKTSENTYMMEYAFKNMTELQKMLNEHCSLWLDSKMLKMLTVEICKNGFDNESKATMDIQKNEKTELPEYIYVF